MFRPMTVFVTLLSFAAPVAAETIIIHAGHVIPEASKPARGPSTITVIDGRITGIANGLSRIEPGTKVIDLSARTVLPELLGHQNDIGRIALGYSADMIAVDGDPLTDVRVLEKVKFVMVQGRVIE